MTTVYDVKADRLINAVAEDLEKEKKIKMPKWATFVKTGVSRERAPDQENWWYIRAASILRKIYMSKRPIGVQRLRGLYSSRKNRGVKPERSFKGGGKIIRTILQDLDKAGFTEKKEKQGRIITSVGRKYLDRIATKLVK